MLLVVEVADTSLEYDRRTKIPLYARRGILEVWLANLVQDHILVHSDPDAEGYRAVRVVRRGESVGPAAFSNRAIAVDRLLG